MSNAAPDLAPSPVSDAEPPSEPAIALHLLEQAHRHGLVLAIVRSAARLRRLTALTTAMGEGTEILPLPPWDVLPYDRTPPSTAAVGRRVRTLIALAEPATSPRPRPRLVLTTAAAALIRVRPPAAWRTAALILRPNDIIDLDRLRTGLAERGYTWDERVDEPGEVALRGQAIDLFPAGDTVPLRLDLDGNRIAAIERFDPITQRTTGPADAAILTPAIEYPLDPDDLDAAAAALDARAWTDPNFAADSTPDLPNTTQLEQRLIPLMSLLPAVPWWADAEVPDRWSLTAEAIQDAHAAATAARRADPDAPLPPRPARLYLTPAQAAAALDGPRLQGPIPGETLPAPTRIAGLVETAQAALAEGIAVVIAIPTGTDPAPVATSLARRGLEARIAADWAEATAGGAALWPVDATAGLRLPGLLLLPIGALLRTKDPAPDRAAEPADAPRCGDVVVHADHGIARLVGLRLVETDAQPEERIALTFADGAELLVPTGELDRIWRYGGGETPVPLDRMGGDAWHRRRAETQAAIDTLAERLADAARHRAQASAPVLIPPPGPYAALARRFPHPPTRDQRAATDAVLADLASGRPMDRLLCGDVGFGKTEIALRAAAAVALAGYQVLIAAPTTVLARQHLDTVRTRFAGTEITVAALIRGAQTPEGRATRRGLRDGSIGIVVGTQALAADGVRFARLGLAIIDEEQRFGEGAKARLHAPHKLVMTATPIPRTLQSALVGLRDVSTLTTPPAARQSTRTFVLPWEAGLVRDALLRERRRGGQSFVVVPRISGLTALAAELAALVPELRIVAAHGRMKPEALEPAVLGFARGQGDVLLATNIIEAGLDIPRANLIVVSGADRFGLAQLHQLRGRVGRGVRRGTAYFLTEPGRRLAPATQRRLRMLESMATLGAGMAVAAADLDLRGGGDLFGAAQTGHGSAQDEPGAIRALGTGLYQHLLAAAMDAQRGLPAPPPTPDLRTGLAGRIPEDYVPEQDLRLSLYARLARIPDGPQLDAFAEELADRFGPCPGPLDALLALHRLRTACLAAGVARVDAGPRATALTPVLPDGLDALAVKTGGAAREGRTILSLATSDPAARVDQLLALLA